MCTLIQSIEVLILKHKRNLWASYFCSSQNMGHDYLLSKGGELQHLLGDISYVTISWLFQSFLTHHYPSPSSVLYQLIGWIHPCDPATVWACGTVPYDGETLLLCVFSCRDLLCCVSASWTWHNFISRVLCVHYTWSIVNHKWTKHSRIITCGLWGKAGSCHLQLPFTTWQIVPHHSAIHFDGLQRYQRMRRKV